METSDGEDQVRFAVRIRGYLWPAIPPLIVFAAISVSLTLDPQVCISWILLTLAAVSARMRLWTLRQAVRTHWLITVDQMGVTWNDSHTTMAWTEVGEVWAHHTFGLGRLVPHLPDRVVLVTPTAARIAAASATRAHGRIIFLNHIDTTMADLTAAISRFTTAPIRRPEP